MNSSHSKDILDEVELLDKPGGAQLRARFAGPFEGNTVRWNATLYTPAAWVAKFGGEVPSQNIIDIELAAEDAHIRLCLKVKQIDRPTLRKAVMMVRQYKRLRRGRHQYG